MSIFTNSISSAAGEAGEYTKAILGLLGAQNPIDVLRATPAAARAAIAGVSDATLSIPEAPGKWSMRQVIRHLADSDVVWGWRLRLVLAQDRPAITGYDQDLWADRLGYATANVEHALEEFAVLRRSNL